MNSGGWGDRYERDRVWRDRATLLACLIALALVLVGCATPDRIRTCVPPSVSASAVDAYQETHGGVHLIKGALCLEWR